MNRFAGDRFGCRRRVPVLVEYAMRSRLTMNLMAAMHFAIATTTARLAACSAAEPAAQQWHSAVTAAFAAITIAIEKPRQPRQAIRLAAIAATAGEAAALVARIAAVRRIADPFTPVHVAATLAAGGLVPQPLLDAAAASHGLAAGPALKGVAVRHPLFIRPAEEPSTPMSTTSSAAPSSAAAAHVLATASAGQEGAENGASADEYCPPGNHREVL